MASTPPHNVGKLGFNEAGLATFKASTPRQGFELTPRDIVRGNVTIDQTMLVGVGSATAPTSVTHIQGLGSNSFRTPQMSVVSPANRHASLPTAAVPTASHVHPVLPPPSLVGAAHSSLMREPQHHTSQLHAPVTIGVAPIALTPVTSPVAERVLFPSPSVNSSIQDVRVRSVSPSRRLGCAVSNSQLLPSTIGSDGASVLTTGASVQASAFGATGVQTFTAGSCSSSAIAPGTSVIVRPLSPLRISPDGTSLRQTSPIRQSVSPRRIYSSTVVTSGTPRATPIVRTLTPRKSSDVTCNQNWSPTRTRTHWISARSCSGANAAPVVQKLVPRVDFNNASSPQGTSCTTAFVEASTQTGDSDCISVSDGPNNAATLADQFQASNGVETAGGIGAGNMVASQSLGAGEATTSLTSSSFPSDLPAPTQLETRMLASPFSDSLSNIEASASQDGEVSRVLIGEPDIEPLPGSGRPRARNSGEENSREATVPALGGSREVGAHRDAGRDAEHLSALPPPRIATYPIGSTGCSEATLLSLTRFLEKQKAKDLLVAPSSLSPTRTDLAEPPSMYPQPPAVASQTNAERESKVLPDAVDTIEELRLKAKDSFISQFRAGKLQTLQCGSRRQSLPTQIEASASDLTGLPANTDAIEELRLKAKDSFISQFRAGKLQNLQCGSRRQSLPTQIEASTSEVTDLPANIDAIEELRLKAKDSFISQFRAGKLQNLQCGVRRQSLDSAQVQISIVAPPMNTNGEDKSLSANTAGREDYLRKRAKDTLVSQLRAGKLGL